jgi:hypothetical protein
MVMCPWCNREVKSLVPIILPEDKKTKKKTLICKDCTNDVYDPAYYQTDDEEEYFEKFGELI